MSARDGMKHEVVDKLKNITDQLLSLLDFDDYDDSVWDDIPDIHTIQHAFQLFTVIVKEMGETLVVPRVGGISEDVSFYWNKEGLRLHVIIRPNSPPLITTYLYIRQGEGNESKSDFFRNQSVHQLIEWLRWWNGTGVAPEKLKEL